MASTHGQPIRIALDQQRGAPRSARQPLDDATPRDPVRSLYLHVPFCFHKCHYCDFYSFVDTKPDAPDRQRRFVESLIREVAALARSERDAGHAPGLDSIFVGGGTPTLLAPDLWRRLGDALWGDFAISHETEWTVECNPETATPELMRTLAELGVNRLSVGAQSFDERHLKTLERWHDPDNVERALDLARDAGIRRVSLDLIFAIPGQTLDQWEADLERAIAIGTGHVSAYALTYEPNTAMTVKLHQGKFDPVDEEVEAAMFERTSEVLHTTGFERYEISNFATPDEITGGPCRHNLAYWRQQQWYAAGPSASAHVGGHRWKNVPRISEWQRAVDETGFAPITDHEPPDPKRALAEKIMTGLRLSEGVDAASLERTDALDNAARRAHNAGHLDIRAGCWRLTEAGLLLADRVTADLMSALD